MPPTPTNRPAIPAPPRSALAERNFPAEAVAAAEADWYAFVLEELNGLGTMLRYRREEKKTAEAAQVVERIHATLNTLAWNRTAALAQTWAFVESQLHDADDAWGPHLVLAALEPKPERVRDWLAALSPEARAIIEDNPMA